VSDLASQPTRDLGARLQALREAGAPERVPVRWHHLHSLHARMADLPPDVAAQLEHALARALLACEHALAQTPTRATPHQKPLPRHAALASLNEHLRQRRAHEAQEAALAGEAIDPSELTSLRRFRTSWSRITAEDQVAQAMARTPDNAGPLNSHALVLRSLALMRELSPDYLQRFLAQLDALWWLEDLGQRPVAAKPVKRSRSRA
jgi:hypothetical protein